MSQRTDSENESKKGIGANRRHVLQGIGAAGVASTIATGSVGADTSGLQRAQAAIQEEQDQEEIPISTQFWSYREDVLGEEMTTAELVHEAADAGYDAFEPFRVGLDTDPDPILEAMDETGLEMGSAHASLDDVLNNPDETAEFYSQFGEPILIHAFEPEETWQSEDSIVEFAQTINEAADLMAERGLPGFGYHNHDQEFVEVDGADGLGYDIFAQEVNDNVHLQIDAGWVLVGDADPIEYIIEYAESVTTIHMKNMTADGEFTEIDEGDVSMRPVATAARNAADVEYLIYEHDQPEDPLESMQIGAEWLEILNQPYSPGGICAIPDADTHPAKLHDPEEETGGEEDGEEADGEEDEDAAGDEAIEPGTQIEFDGVTNGWVGIAPDSIADEENPTLTLQEGETYEIGWTEGDGAQHNIAIYDENDDVVDDLQTEVVSEPEDQWLEFEASSEMVTYICEVHPGTMVGEIAVTGGDE